MIALVLHRCTRSSPTPVKKDTTIVAVDMDVFADVHLEMAVEEKQANELLSRAPSFKRMGSVLPSQGIQAGVWFSDLCSIFYRGTNPCSRQQHVEQEERSSALAEVRRLLEEEERSREAAAHRLAEEEELLSKAAEHQRDLLRESRERRRRAALALDAAQLEQQLEVHRSSAVRLQVERQTLADARENLRVLFAICLDKAKGGKSSETSEVLQELEAAEAELKESEDLLGVAEAQVKHCVNEMQARQRAAQMAEGEVEIATMAIDELVEHVLLGQHIPYVCLGVGNDASRETVRKHYLALARRLHPDKTEHPCATEAFEALENARRAYDMSTLQPQGSRCI